MEVLCVVCGEPWDFYGLSHGDMEGWEADLFKKGAGCPACEGAAPEIGAFVPASIGDLENGDLDPILRLNAWEAAQSSDRPAWTRPAPRVLWTCSGCGVQATISPDNGEREFDLPLEAKGRAWYSSHIYQDAPEEEGEKIGGDVFCPECVCACAHCPARLIAVPFDFSDTYDVGQGFISEGTGCNAGDALCIDCFESLCSECGSHPEDCTCNNEVGE